MTAVLADLARIGGSVIQRAVIGDTIAAASAQRDRTSS
jgi:hypothetical protein